MATLADFQLSEELYSAGNTRICRAVPRAVVPNIALTSPKITRKLTTEWFADRVEERQRRCLAKLPG